MPPIPITAADYLGSTPVISLLGPSDKDFVTAALIRQMEAGLLANDKYLQSGANVEHTYTETNLTAPYNIGTAIAGAWTDTNITQNVPNARIGDDLKITVWGMWQLNSSSNATTCGQLRVQIVEDSAGTPTTVNASGIAVMAPEGITLPRTQPYALHVVHRVTDAGTAKVTLQGQVSDLSGGAGTGSIVLVFSGRIDVTLVKRGV